MSALRYGCLFWSWHINAIGSVAQYLDAMPPTSHFLQYFPLVLDTFTYGIYCALFVQSTQMLINRRRANYKVYLACLSALFGLSTMHIVAAYTWAFITDTATTGIYEVLSLRKRPPDLYGADDPMAVHRLVRVIRARYALANLLADAVLIHRCYVIWGHNLRAIAFLLVAYIVNIGGIVVGALPFVGPSERIAIAVCIGTTFFTNVAASLMAAGRIWWISRRASVVLSRGSRRMYYNLTAILLESGLIYPISIVIAIAMFVAPQTSTEAVLISIAPIYHLVAIAPTLIIVRVGLGMSTEGVDRAVTTGPDRFGGPGSLHFSPPMTDQVGTIELGIGGDLENSVSTATRTLDNSFKV
ncbi:Ras-GEF domain-containing protein [Mycena indigotica]|uniref:Ras-GEF domain-containing protein n=1 Tax=Mycena indigotica TaxID=2126181 RepID=A0A8H6SSJ3_9AGAR|nr:Ras-GEF domain-containing protein [Mycena indigotica]KAF7303896.1 Ras-GEF domain-containing protein [Mycena indigotica]